MESIHVLDVLSQRKCLFDSTSLNIYTPVFADIVLLQWLVGDDGCQAYNPVVVIEDFLTFEKY